MGSLRRPLPRYAVPTHNTRPRTWPLSFQHKLPNPSGVTVWAQFSQRRTIHSASSSSAVDEGEAGAHRYEHKSEVGE